jgi:KTSC domain
MRRKHLESSVIESVAFDEEKNILDVRLHSGRTYRYFMVPKDVYEGLLRAESHGAYFNTNIRNRFPYQEITTT